MKIVTPASRLFLDPSVGLSLASASDSLEFRPDLSISPTPSYSYSHCHISDPRFDINLPWSQGTRLALEESLAEITNYNPALSFHLARDCVEVAIDERGRYVPLGESLHKEEMLENVVANVGWVRRHLGNQVLIENNNFYNTGAYDLVTSPIFITEVISEARAGFLLDVAHAAVSAHNLGEDLRSYLEELPLGEVQQVHLSSPSLSQNEMVDSHDPPDQRLISDTLKLPGLPELSLICVTVEHYADPTAVLHAIELLGKAREEKIK